MPVILAGHLMVAGEAEEMWVFFFYLPRNFLFDLTCIIFKLMILVVLIEFLECWVKWNNGGEAIEEEEAT